MREDLKEIIDKVRCNADISDYTKYIDSLLEACDRVAEQIDGEFDSAEDLRQIRNERVFMMII